MALGPRQPGNASAAADGFDADGRRSRRKECGRPCQICANECEVRAINQIGQINFNECHYCLDCQVTYNNDRKCPPLVERRKKRERAARPLPTPVLVTSAYSSAAPPRMFASSLRTESRAAGT